MGSKRVSLPSSNRSEILTVWRTLWIETDSMRDPNLLTEGPFDQPLADAEYDKSLVDVPDPPIDLLFAEYQRADIEVKRVDAANDPTDGNGSPGWFAHYLDFNLNTGEMPIAMGRAATMADWATQNENEFWIGQLIGAYELHPDRDNDPDAETDITGWAVGSSNVAFVFFETTRDLVAELLPNICDELTAYQRSTLHESGHFFGLPDRNGPGQPRGIMNYFDMWDLDPGRAHHNWTDLGTIQGHPKPEV